MDTTVEFNEWLDYAKNLDTTPWNNIKEQFDVDTAIFLKDAFTGFMTAPVAMFKGVPLESKSRVFDGTVDGLLGAKAFLEDLNTKNELFLYQVIFHPATITYRTVDPETCEPVFLDPPKMSNAAWKIRYAALNDENAQALEK